MFPQAVTGIRNFMKTMEKFTVETLVADGAVGFRGL